ncbi:hypothetical protein [Mesorhizobium sp. IMUNJ 23232]|uniref:hypothetical protein n=1 Tax=Mesorhizobium sp. IMUNJ 23232 TaxID=3376064 RepID=UPI0037AF34DF
MSKNHELAGLIKWSNRDEWQDLFDDVFDEHFGLAFEDYGIDFEQLEKLIGETEMRNLWGCAFEDFLTRPGSEDDERTIVDDYLKRRGWKESPSVRRYMEALRDSLFSLYEVSEIVPGQSMLLRDLIRGGEPVRVTEHTATRSLQNLDRLGCRVVEVSGKHRLAGGMATFSEAAFAELIVAVSEPLKRIVEEASKQESPPDADTMGIDFTELAETMFLHGSAPEFTAIWLEDRLNGKIDKVPPPRFNSDGEELSFHTITYPLTPGASVDAIARRLGEIPELLVEEEHLWNWTEPADAGAPATPSAKVSHVEGERLHIELEDGTPVFATIELTADMLVVSANSKQRADRAKLMLKSVLKGQIGQPGTQIHNLEELAALEDGESPAADDVLAKLLDLPLDVLDDATPREAVRTEKGRNQVVKWLEETEEWAKERPELAGYDFGWMWEELGITDRRSRPN